jgi:hypothetical protein
MKTFVEDLAHAKDMADDALDKHNPCSQLSINSSDWSVMQLAAS